MSNVYLPPSACHSITVQSVQIIHHSLLWPLQVRMLMSAHALPTVSHGMQLTDEASQSGKVCRK